MVALILLIITAGFSYAAFRQYLIGSQLTQLLSRGHQVARVMHGYFTGSIDAPTATYLMSGLEGALNAHVYVVDQTGEVILSTGQSTSPIVPVPINDLKQVLWRAKTWSAILPSSGGSVSVAGVPILLDHTVAGGIFLEKALAPADTRALGLLSRLLLGGLLGALVAAASAIVLSRRLTEPLAAMNEAAAGIASGHLDTRVKSFGPGELTQLATSFNRMAESLEALVENLRRQTEAQDVLLTHVAHDLKTPLTTVRGYLEALQDHLVTGQEADRALAVAHAETLRLQRLVGRLLEAARLEAELGNASESILVADWARDAAVRLTPQAQSKHVDIRVNADDSLVVRGHRDGLTEVLVNLLDNAIQASPPGSVVTIEAEPWNTGVRVAVRDEGTGIPDGLHSQLFEPFVTGDQSRSGGRTGLGLSIVSRLIGLMGGMVGIDRPSQGACVWFWLPRPNA